MQVRVVVVHAAAAPARAAPTAALTAVCASLLANLLLHLHLLLHPLLLHLLLWRRLSEHSPDCCGPLIVVSIPLIVLVTGGAAGVDFKPSDVIVFTPPKCGTTWVTTDRYALYVAVQALCALCWVCRCANASCVAVHAGCVHAGCANAGCVFVV